MRIPCTFLIVLGCLSSPSLLFSGDVGGPIEVAAQVQGSQLQFWPRAAWAPAANCWLVVWRDGYMNREATDVIGGRVSADGKALDSSGVQVCKAKDRQEKAVVASDGKGWLVVWEDFRNGKDYDIYAARVAADGKVLDPDGVLVAGGEHNQCWPALAFAGGNYVVAWQAFVGDTPDGTKCKDGGVSGYRLFGTAISPDGKIVTPNGALLSPTKIQNSLRPVATADEIGKRVLIAFNVVADKAQQNNVGTLWVDGVTGKAGEMFYRKPVGSDSDDKIMDGSSVAVAWGKGGGLVLLHPDIISDFFVVRLDATGAVAWTPGGRDGKIEQHLSGFAPHKSIACDGESYLVTRDRHVVTKPPQKSGVEARLRPSDWDGKDPDKEFFKVAGDGKTSCLMGQAAPGPKGTFLVTYVEARGVEDIKVMARLVK